VVADEDMPAGRKNEKRGRALYAREPLTDESV